MSDESVAGEEKSKLQRRESWRGLCVYSITRESRAYCVLLTFIVFVLWIILGVVIVYNCTCTFSRVVDSHVP